MVIGGDSVPLYKTKEQAEKGKIQNVQFDEKGRISKCHGAKTSVQGNKKFKESLDAKWIKENGELWARLHPDKLPICGKELNKNFSNEGNHHKTDCR